MSFGVTPRQTCPPPEGFGRNLRSKTRWFAGFCNSHQVSHFATFFIDARAEISVAESRDAQADVPSARRLRAQLAFKNSMVRGILQFTPGIAFCYVLHRCESRDIRCRESCRLRCNRCPGSGRRADRSAGQEVVLVFLGARGAVGSFSRHPPSPREVRGGAACRAGARRHG